MTRNKKYDHKPEPHTGSWSGETYCFHVPLLLRGKPNPKARCMVSLKKHPDGSWQHAPELDR